ncbi:MAG: porin family protein [Clostridium sp.]|nr:porin family protein [Clostridium sp.]
MKRVFLPILALVVAGLMPAAASSPSTFRPDLDIPSPGEPPEAENTDLVLPPDEREGATEVCISYDALPAMRFISGYRNGWNHMDPWGGVTVSLDHRFAPGLWLGLSYNISSASTNDASEGRDGAITWHSLMVHSRYEYWRSGRWRLYGVVGIGVIISYMQPSWADTYNRTQFAFQVTPVGCSYRVLENLDLFADAGFGVQGILRAGFRIDF